MTTFKDYALIQLNKHFRPDSKCEELALAEVERVAPLTNKMSRDLAWKVAKYLIHFERYTMTAFGCAQCSKLNIWTCTPECVEETRAMRERAFRRATQNIFPHASYYSMAIVERPLRSPPPVYWGLSDWR